MNEENYTARLVAPGYEMFLYAAPPLAVRFLETRWQAGMTATGAASLLSKHGYVAPARVEDVSKGRVLGHQSTLRNIGVMEWAA